MSSSSSVGSAKVTCIIADDADILREVLRIRLASIPWLRLCGEAADGFEALDMIATVQPEIAILDLRMPGMSGFSVAAEVRARQIKTNIIIYSAFTHDDNAAQACELGVRFVSKCNGFGPLEAELLRVKVVLAEPAAPAGEFV